MLLLITGSVFAQEGVKFGFRVSPMLSFPTVTDSSKAEIPNSSYGVKPGISFGLMVNFGFSETVGLSTGLHIQARNFQGSSSYTILGVTTTALTKYNITTLELPVQLKLRSPEIGDGIYVVGMFGGAAEVNLSNKKYSEVSVTGLGTSSSTERDNKYINPVTASFIPGAGVDWEFDWGTLYMGASYHWGLMNVLNKKNNGYVNAKMNAVFLDLGYYF